MRKRARELWRGRELPGYTASQTEAGHRTGRGSVLHAQDHPPMGMRGVSMGIGQADILGLDAVPVPMLSARFDRALVLTALLHAAQPRKGTTIPYIAHLLAVCSIVLEHGGDEDDAIAALLHDAVEDQGGRPTLERIRLLFGERVAAIVDGCTDTDQVPKPPWRARKEAYIAHLATVDESVLLVSLADKLHNAQSLLRDHCAVGEAVWARFNAGRPEQVWYYRTLVAAFRSRSIHTELVDELDRTVTEIEATVGEP